MTEDLPADERIEALHAEAEELADIADNCRNPHIAQEYREDAKRKIRQAARLRQEAGL